MMSDKRICIDDYEKLQAKVADNAVYITELLEKKTQAEEQLKEKQIIAGIVYQQYVILDDRIFF